ncbi:MAG: Dam family site-specific DNA-(adenine-N6)-methyltransferase [Caldilinea sp.]|jgi:DNA adenine methylase
MKPFLKWAGNKFQIVEQIRQSLPMGKRLIEPFVGSGAVFLNIDAPRYLLSDANGDLIHLYATLQEEGEGFVSYCRQFFAPDHNDPDVYCRRRALFNDTEDKRLRSALFLYLNKHCYNGLCRYNCKGRFNVPFGRYKQPYFPEKELLFFAARASRAVFQQADFLEIMLHAERGDVVYCDPPYVPLSETANFTSYSAGGFGLDAHHGLADEARLLARRGIPVLISNHDTPFVREIYAGAEIVGLQVQRYISRDGNNRNKAGEVLALFR